MSEQTTPLHHDPAAAAALHRSTPFLRIRPDTLTGEAAAVITLIVLGAVLVFGAYLRFTHNNWDQAGSGPGAHSAHLHPDERFLTTISNDTSAPDGVLDYFDTDNSPLNPYNVDIGNGNTQPTFVYGTLPLFLTKFAATHYNTLTLGFVDQDQATYDRYNLVGRRLSAFFDTATILLIFLIGWRLANRPVGLMAAFLYAFSPFPIQNAHFFIVDSFMAFFATLSIYFAVRAAQSGGFANLAVAGIAAGLAMAGKTTALALLPVIILAAGIFAWPAIKPYLLPFWTGDGRDGEGERSGRRLDDSILRLDAGSAIALVGAFIAYRIAMPYAFNAPSLSDWFSYRSFDLPLVSKFVPFDLARVPYPDIMNQHWIQDQASQRRLLDGEAFPPNVQWIGRARWIWPLQQMVVWGMGPALGAAAWIGVAFALVYAIRKQALVWLVPLAWVIGYFGFMGSQFSLYMRYFLPLYPALCVLAAFVLYKLWEWGSSDEPFAAFGRVRSRLNFIAPALPYATAAAGASVLVLTMAMGLAFYQIYTKQVTRTEASAWMQRNIPEGSVVGHEHWDDPVPHDVAGVERRPFAGIEFNNFNGDTPEKVEELLQNIDDVDYIALSSQRLSTTIPRIPAVFPVTTRYYAALENGDLGFRMVAEFTSYPEIFGIELNDDTSEESFTVYDHPKVVVYEKTDGYSPERARMVLGADAFTPGCNVLPKFAAQNCLLFTPDVLERQQAGDSWSDIFDPGSVINDHPLFFWLITLELAAFALVPLALVVFRALPDRGYLLTKPLGVLGLSYLVYAPSSYGLADFTRPTIAAALAVMFGVGALAGYVWRSELIAFVRERWRFVLLCEAIFLGMFLFSYMLRINNPDLYHPFQGGEKPMDFTYFNGVLRTTDLTQGAIDPWYAGAYINYYWWGFFIAAVPTKLLGIVPEVAYNLSVPMFYSLAAAATFSVAYNLSEATRRFMRRRPNRTPIGARGPIFVGLLATFLVLIAGNLRAVGVLEQNFDRVSPWHSDLPLIGPLVIIAGGFWEVIFGDASFRQLVYSYDWWAPSRALAFIPTPENGVQPITEFPFWTFLFADMHAHLMAIPFALTAIGVSLGVVLNFTRLNPRRAEGRTFEMQASSWVMVALIGLITGALRWINSWDYPVFLVLGAAAILIAEMARERRLNGRGVAFASLKIVAMVGLSYALFSVVAKNYSTEYGSVEQSNQTSDLSDFFTHWGVFLFFIFGFGLFALSRALARDTIVRSIFFGTRRPRSIDVLPLVLALITLGFVITWIGAMNRSGPAALSFCGVIGIALCAWRELRSPSPMAPVMLFVYAMTALGLGLTGFVEVVTLKGDVGRTNTVFKFYLHVWLMWGIVSAYALWLILDVMRPHDALLRRAREFTPLVRVPRYAFAAVAAVLLILTLVYPYFGTRARLNDREVDWPGDSGLQPAQATNDGLDYLERVTVYHNGPTEAGTGGPHELKYTRDAITWVRENIEGSPTTIEAIGESYRSLGSRIAINTGLPTVTGWDFHQRQQRGKFAYTVSDRQNDIRTFYGTTDVGEAQRIIDKYDVEWVIVGDEERYNNPEEGFDKFTSGLNGVLELAYENPAIRIFHVIPAEELTEASAASN